VAEASVVLAAAVPAVAVREAVGRAAKLRTCYGS